ncbi:methylated-DNA--protein-cysteine methyltransferase [Deinococcus piscis]|uniref:Methylated-DNA--protein-cysteine methyltransferase n=1 Tax=Deinococcus piscis TaxID=394230 RepID=A0ABQ3JY03_9DEIO|nr:MGMT family protein [Deinococcus piscis]GHF95183.1 methylated-DNA--protein-cysteine methyltransferase [Deinococcus piscis]
MSEPSFRERILALVARIPPGRVMTYGQLALLAGQPGAARQAGYVMNSLVDREHGLPWQRVVNAQGRISTGKIGLGELQQALLQAEGVAFDASGRLDLQALQWWPPEAQDAPPTPLLLPD